MRAAPEQHVADCAGDTPPSGRGEAREGGAGGVAGGGALPSLAGVPEEAGGWRCESLADADWCLRRIADLRAEQRENEEIAQRRIDEIRLRLDNLSAPIQRGLAFFEGQLRVWADAHRAELLKGGKAKTRKLPSGAVSWRLVPAKLEVADPERALLWAQANGCVRTKVEVDKSALNERFRTSGEVPDGCDVSPEREEFQVKPLEVE